MSGGEWRYALASVRGTSHVRDDSACQDASACRVLTTPAGEPILVAIVADGAGSAAHSAVGSRLACTMFVDEMATLFADGGQVAAIDRTFVTDWLIHFQHAIAARAEATGSAPRDFACTLVAAVVAPDSAAFIQVGDGAIVVGDSRAPDEYCWIFWPQNGEYQNETIFATDPRVSAQVEHEVERRRIDELALFTDGLQRLALHVATQSVHNPFFRPMFAPLRPLAPGHLAETSDALAAFLGSPAVNARTDDDKTLILATRHRAMTAMGDDRAEGPRRVAPAETTVADGSMTVEPRGERARSDGR